MRRIMRAADRLHAVLTTELVDPSCCINDLLGAGIKRVACGTDIDVQFVGQRRLGLKLIAATTNDFDFLIRRMNIGLHFLDSRPADVTANCLEGRGRITVVGLTGK